MSDSFVLTASASQEIDDILEYILENSGPVRALRLHDKLYEGFSKVAAHPGIGHRRGDLADETLRIWPIFSYLIIYRPETRPVEIIHVIHGARDVPKVIEEEL